MPQLVICPGAKSMGTLHETPKFLSSRIFGRQLQSLRQYTASRLTPMRCSEKMFTKRSPSPLTYWFLGSLTGTPLRETSNLRRPSILPLKDPNHGHALPPCSTRCRDRPPRNSGTPGKRGFPKLWVPFWGEGPNKKEYNIWGSILRSPYLGKVPYWLLSVCEGQKS